MDALVMCGGRGIRLAADAEKPLVRIGGVPMVQRVIAALEGAASVGAVHATVSPHTPETCDFLHGRVPLVETSGDGYVADLDEALEEPRLERPLLTVVADLPLLGSPLVDDAIRAHDDSVSLTVATPTALRSALGISADITRAHGGRDVSPTGLNVVGSSTTGNDSDEVVKLSWDARLAVNVNYAEDRRVAEALASDGSTEEADGSE